LCRTIRRDDLITDERFATSAARVANKPAMVAELKAALDRYSTEDAVALLSRNQIVAAAVRTYSQVRAAPDIQASGIFMRTAGPESYEALHLPYSMNGKRTPSGGIPAIGEHTCEILREAGFSANEAELLKADGIVAG
jgi:crotonobetainyl-CoA:carnitine CoA-transferase CaiB-like acyl-CoA transferase